MNIEQIFEKRLDRNINGVVKAEQTDDASAWIELDEYVITRELEGHLRHFFESYVPATGPERIRMENKIGVWVSGFFGSGKSHFIKILSYLLSNRKVSHNGTERNAYSFFEDKIKDALFLADINKAVHHPTEVILFNIDSRANVDDKEDAILKVFLKVFNERVGYCADFPHIAHLERELAKRGQYDAFKTAFSTITGSSWEKERDSYYFISDEMAEALSQATGQSVDASRQWVEQLDKNFPLDINNFCQWVKEWLDENGKNILFMVDEVGQFIGKNTQMMLKLQTITENLGVICGGRAWVIVTSQADINAAIGGMSSSDGQDFSKIQGRFSTRLQLSSSNTSEVIQKRLLVKTDAAKPALAKVWQEKGDILRNQLAFDPTTTASCRPYTSEGDGCILIRLPADARTWIDIDLVVQTEKFLRDNAGQRPEQASLLSEKARENSVREKMLRVQLESLIAEADVWAIGERLPKKSSTPSSIVDEACRYVIENTFGKLKMLRPFNGDIAREIHALLTVENDTELDLGELEESNPEAMREVETWVSMNIEYNKPVYLRDILNHFARRPYGWPEEEVKLLVARLARKGKFSFSQQNNNIERKQVWELFNNSRRHSELRLHKIRRHDESQIRKAAQLMADIAQQPFSEREEPALVEHIRQVFDGWKQELNVFKAKAEGGNNPGKDEIDSGLRLLNSILSEKEDFALIEKVTSLANELLDFSEDREDLVDFYRKQFATWQKLGAALNGSFKSNRSALEKDAVAVKALGELESIWQMPEPYKHLNRITPLIEQVQNVNHQLVEQHRQHALERIDARIEESRQRLQEAHSTSELQNSVLLPMQKARKRAEVSQSIPEILAEQQETMALQTDAEKKINQWIDELRKKQEAQLRATSEAKHAAESQQTYVVVEKPVIQPVPKKTHLVNVASEMRKATGSEVLETAEQVEKALDTLRAALLAAIEAGDRIRLQ